MTPALGVTRTKALGRCWAWGLRDEAIELGSRVRSRAQPPWGQPGWAEAAATHGACLSEASPALTKKQ